MSYNVSPTDVEDRWRPLSDAETPIAQTLLDDLVNDLDVHRPALEATLAALLADDDDAVVAKGLMLQRVIVKTLANVVKNALRNPDVLRSTTIGADGSIGVGYDNTAADILANAAMLSAADYRSIDLAVLSASGTTPSAVNSVRLVINRHRERDINCLPVGNA